MRYRFLTSVSDRIDFHDSETNISDGSQYISNHESCFHPHESEAM